MASTTLGGGGVASPQDTMEALQAMMAPGAPDKEFSSTFLTDSDPAPPAIDLQHKRGELAAARNRQSRSASPQTRNEAERNNVMSSSDSNLPSAKTTESSSTIRPSFASAITAVTKNDNKRNSKSKSTFPGMKFVPTRRLEDKKVVGLKNYGQSMKELRKKEWISSSAQSLPLDDIHRSTSGFTPTSNGSSPTNNVSEREKSQSDRGVVADTTDAQTAPATNMADPYASWGLEPPAIGGANKIKGDFVKQIPPPAPKTVEELEEIARKKALINPFHLLYLGNIAALKVMGFYLVTLETFITCGLTIGLTIYWYNEYADDDSWNGGGLDFVLLAFAVTTPISAAIGMAFTRRERALIAVADFRSFSYHLFLAHCLWDWPDEGRSNAEVIQGVDWLEHCDAVLAQLIGIGDELSRFLTLPTASRGRHRMTKSGRREAARTMEVAYYLLESMTTHRMTRLIMYSERLKKIGLPSGEVSRIRQYERFLSDLLEQLRMVKMYRTPQALRSFARLFTMLLPPFYAPTYAQVARDLDSLAVGVIFGVITALGLTALFESLQVLEDPFTAFLALDGIDAREEFEVLHFSQLIQTRKLVFPNAAPYPAGRRAALTRRSHRPEPTQTFPAYGVDTTADPTASVKSGITFKDETEVGGATSRVHGPGDGTPPVKNVMVDRLFSEEELGAHLPDDDMTTHHNRASVFDEDRASESDDDDDDTVHAGDVRPTLTQNPSFFNLGALTRKASRRNSYNNNPNSGHPASIHSTPAFIGLAGAAAPTEAATAPPDIATAHRRTRTTVAGGPPPARNAHRRTHTSTSAAGLFPANSKFRLPDF